MPRLTLVTESYRRCLANREFYDQFFLGLNRRIPDVLRYFEDADMRIMHGFLRKAVTTSLMEAAGSPAAAKQLEKVRQMHGQGQLDIPLAWFPLWLEALIDAVRAADAEVSYEIETAWREVMQRAVHLVTPDGAHSRERSPEPVSRR